MDGMMDLFAQAPTRLVHVADIFGACGAVGFRSQAKMSLFTPSTLTGLFPPTPSQSCPNQYRATIQRTIHARDGSLAVVTTDGYVVVSVVVPGIDPPDRLDNGMSIPVSLSA
jgi:hypothetical protein